MLELFCNFVLSPVVILCDILGCLCIALNLFITTVIIKNRKRILKNIFYILVLHCSIVDLLRGCCLILWSLPHTLISNYTATYDQALLFNLSNYQFITMILRSCNLLTIFNLLIFTCNEFTVVHYPLFYRHRFRRPAHLFLMFCFPNFFDNFLQFCYGSIMRTIRRLRKENLMNEGRLRHVQDVNRTRRHYWRSHRMYKYKHVIVIGTVLFVYILFLLPYSGIQLIAILHITNIISVPSHFALIKWSLQVLTGVHAVCQPICYFRMAEFRHLAYFGGKIKQRNFSSRSPTHSNKPCKT
uniref:G_PROTEIN_RECEP_F1_2 domain-containing protein n=1 Tax=Elaeophora elaphi TaxID=1147741 RepID=A0A0R3RVC7_9BILA